MKFILFLFLLLMTIQGYNFEDFKIKVRSEIIILSFFAALSISF